MVPPVVPVPVAAGRVLGGRYRLVAKIARGGMAEVWEGHDEVLARPVAVKVLQPHLAEDGVFLERFRREAITAARLAHPGVVATYDAGSDTGTAYIVMELIRGRTLRQLLAERGPMEPELAMGVAAQIADALAHAHRSGLVHRDIKPANVLLTDEEGGQIRAKVTDFGIAKASAGLEQDLTRTGIVLGTPKYLSPEQIQDREPDSRADLYALGVVLYEMVVGEPPFVGSTDMATALAHVHDEPVPMSRRRPGVPPALDRLSLALLAKDPADRVPSAVAVGRALASISSGRPSLEAPVPRRAPPPSTAGLALPPGAFQAGPTGTRPSPPIAPGRGMPAHGRPAPVAAPDMTGHWSGAPPRPAPQGSRTGVFPPPSSAPTGAGEGAPRRPARRRRWMRGPGVLVLCLVLAAAMVAGVLLLELHAGHRPGSPISPAAAASPIRISKVSVFMVVAGRPLDDPAGTKYTFDGNPNTAWHTDLYNSPTFGNLYPGIGLAIDLGASHTVHRLVVTSPTQGWSAQTYVSGARVANGQPVTAWGSPTATRKRISGSTTFNLAGRRGRWVLLWLTNLGPADQATVAELSVS